MTEYYSVSFRERKGGTRLKEKGGWGGLECRIDVGKLYANSVRVSGGVVIGILNLQS